MRTKTCSDKPVMSKQPESSYFDQTGHDDVVIKFLKETGAD
jgi:hypothetical protein